MNVCTCLSTGQACKLKLTSAAVSSGARIKVAVPLPAGETGGISTGPGHVSYKRVRRRG